MRALDFLIDWVVEQERGDQVKIARGILEDLEFVDHRDFMLEELDRLTNTQLKEMRDYLDEKIENNEAETSMCDDCLYDLIGLCKGDELPCEIKSKPEAETVEDDEFKVGDRVRIKPIEELKLVTRLNAKGKFYGLVDRMLEQAGRIMFVSDVIDDYYLLDDSPIYWKAEMLEKVKPITFFEWLLEQLEDGDL